jgi:hypothetical protein
LEDQETKSELPSKVKKYKMDEIVTFVEARETGQRSIAGLGGITPASQAVNAVKPGPSKKCHHCWERGHTSKFEQRKALCMAFNKVCQRCRRNGHIPFCCNTKDPNKTDPKMKVVVVQYA